MLRKDCRLAVVRAERLESRELGGDAEIRAGNGGDLTRVVVIQIMRGS